MKIDEVTMVEILCDQNIFENAIKNGTIVLGTAIMHDLEDV